MYPQVHPMGHLAIAQGFSGMESQGRKGRTGTDLVGTVTMLPGTLAGTSIGETQRKPGSLWSRNWKTPFDRTTYLLFDATRVWGAGREYDSGVRHQGGCQLIQLADTQAADLMDRPNDSNEANLSRTNQSGIDPSGSSPSRNSETDGSGVGLSAQSQDEMDSRLPRPILGNSVEVDGSGAAMISNFRPGTEFELVFYVRTKITSYWRDTPQLRRSKLERRLGSHESDALSHPGRHLDQPGESKPLQSGPLSADLLNQGRRPRCHLYRIQFPAR